MPTTITSAGITFNDATSLTSAVIPANAVGATQIANGSVTAEKLGTNEQKQIAKAWVNFNGNIGTVNAPSTNTISCNSGSTTGTWNFSGWTASDAGVIYKITQINGISGATFGGVDVSTLGIQILSIVGSSATFRFLSGTTTSAQSVTGTGSSASGFSFIETGIRSSYNVSTVTKIGLGSYTVNFTTPMTDTNFSVSGACSTAGGPYVFGLLIAPNTATSVSVSTTTPAGAGIDVGYVAVQIFGN